jgi:hypothetical protein
MVSCETSLLGSRPIEEIPYILANDSSRAARRLRKAMPHPIMRVISAPFDFKHHSHMGPKLPNKQHTKLTDGDGIIPPSILAIDTAQSSRVHSLSQRIRWPRNATRFAPPKTLTVTGPSSDCVYRFDYLPKVTPTETSDHIYSLSGRSPIISSETLNKQDLLDIQNPSHDIFVSASGSEASLELEPIKTVPSSPTALSAPRAPQEPRCTHVEPKFQLFQEATRRAVECPDCISRLVHTNSRDNIIKQQKVKAQDSQFQQEASGFQFEALGQTHHCASGTCATPHKQILRACPTKYAASLREARRLRNIAADARYEVSLRSQASNRNPVCSAAEPAYLLLASPFHVGGNSTSRNMDGKAAAQSLKICSIGIMNSQRYSRQESVTSFVSARVKVSTASKRSIPSNSAVLEATASRLEHTILAFDPDAWLQQRKWEFRHGQSKRDEP